MIDRHREAEFIHWLRSEMSGLGPLLNPRLSAMREAGGIDYTLAETQSVALQSEFDNVTEATLWRDTCFADLAVAFTEKFGPEAMVFTSIFEAIHL